MTARERFLLVGGLVLGLLAAGVIFGISRLVRPEVSVAYTDELLPAVPQPRSEKPSIDPGGHDHGGAALAEATQPLQSAQLTEDEQRSIGLQTQVVRHRLIRRELVAVARVEGPETQLANISARIGGRIDKLYVDYTGQPVRRGQPMAEIYSPEILSSAEEYKLSMESRRRLSGGAEPQAISGADEVVTASRRRLELWGLSAQQIEAIGVSDKPQIDLTIYSPANGIVMERKVTRGQYVNTGDVLYTVTDLSTVWVKADVYEADVLQVHVGQTVEITSESLPDAKLRGQVGFLEPVVNGQTRTTAARIQVANPRMRLRPGMFVQARFALSEQHVLAVPRSAVVDSGTHKLVYVAKGNGIFEAHEVQVGAVGEDFYPVLSGLKDGERIVIEGNFLLDSQTRISGGMSGMFGGSKEFNEQPAAPESLQFRVSFRSEPVTPQGGTDAALHVAVQDVAGKSVPDAQVKVRLFMPAMPAMGMAEMRESSVLNWKGSEYVGSMKVPTPGTWTVTVEVSQGGKLLTNYRTSLHAK